MVPLLAQYIHFDLYSGMFPVSSNPPTSHCNIEINYVKFNEPQRALSSNGSSYLPGAVLGGETITQGGHSPGTF